MEAFEPFTTARPSRRQFVIGTVAASATWLLAACTAGAPSTSTGASAAATQAPAGTTAPAATSAPAAATAAPKPAAGGPVIAQEADWINLDISKVTAFSQVQAMEHVYESLVMFDRDMQIQPALAQSWDTPDPTTYIFHLRPGVKWHNGREFVASDVVYWYERMMDPATAAPYKSSYTVIQSVEPVDDHTVKMTLSSPFASLLSFFASLRGSAIPNKETVQQYGDLTTHAVGTGPFKVVDYAPGNYIKYAKHADYWDKGVPIIDSISMNLMVDEAQRVAALRARQAHIGVLSFVGAQSLANQQSVTVMQSPKAWELHVIINSAKKPFDDIRVRQALSKAIDRNAIIEKAVQGAGKPSGPIPNGHGDWPLPIEKLPYQQDVEGAKKLLADAGYPNGFPATIIATQAYPEMAANAVELKNQLKAINIDLNVQLMEWGELLKVMDAGGSADKTFGYDLISGAFSFFPDPDIYLGWFMPERNFFIRSTTEGMKNAGINDLLTKAQATLDHAARRQMYQEAEMRMLTEQIPALFLYSVDQVEGVSTQLKNYEQSFMGRHYLIKNASFA